MLDNFFTKPLELQIGENILKFNSETDFEFSMAGRTAIPSAKILDLLKLSRTQLKEEEVSISKIKDSFSPILSQAIEDLETIDRALRELNTTIFTNDQNWRDIFKALNEADEKCNPLRRIAISEYLHYLTALEETIGYIFEEKNIPLESAPAESESQIPDFAATLGPANLPMGSGTSTQIEDEFVKIPKDEVVKIMVTSGMKLAIKLSEYACQLVASDDKIFFVDQAGKKSILRKGRNTIGRSSNSIVKIDATIRDVSRTHVLIENKENQIIQLIDVSSAGTFISSKDL